MKVALVGNQNSGKTMLFNLLTASHQKIGNWPGVTIEKKSGKIKGTDIELVDLPGIYSLSPYTVEEEIARKFVLEEKPDVVINIVDATSTERSLYLTTQLLELGTKIIVALNMTDLLEKKGLTINEEILSEELGVPVIKISALKNTGIKELKEEVLKKSEKENALIKIYHADIEEMIHEIQEYLQIESRFIAVKILENDRMYAKYQEQIIRKSREKIEGKYEMEIEEVIANARYDAIVQIKQKCLIKKETSTTFSERLDKLFLNKWIAFPIFILVMFLVYYLSVGVVGTFTVDFMSSLIETVSELTKAGLMKIGTSEWVVSLVVDGIIAGVGAILTFIPQLIILFLCISILETTGYMSRITFLLDRLFKRFGLSGETLIPFIVGLGCSVPAILSTRVIKDQKERELSIMLTPFIPCSAKLPIIALFTGYFFGARSGIVSASLYFFAILVILVSAFIIQKLFMIHHGTTFISELPEYKMPSARYVAKDVWDKTIEFIKRAGTIILLCSVAIWFLLSFSWRLEYGVVVEESILASIGNTLSWIFYPILGVYSWEATVSAVQGLIAKEQVISSMTIIAGLSEGTSIFAQGAFGFFTAHSAYAFMIFNLFSAPCFGAIGAMGREFGSTQKLLKAICFQTALAWILAALVYQFGTWIGGALL